MCAEVFGGCGAECYKCKSVIYRGQIQQGGAAIKEASLLLNLGLPDSIDIFLNLTSSISNNQEH